MWLRLSTLVLLSLSACAGKFAHPPQGIAFPAWKIDPVMNLAGPYHVRLGDVVELEETRRFGDAYNASIIGFKYRVSWRVQELHGEQRRFSVECTTVPEQMKQLSESEPLPAWMCLDAVASSDPARKGLWLQLSGDCGSGRVGLGSQVLEFRSADDGDATRFRVLRDDAIVGAFEARGGPWHGLWPSPELTRDEQIAVSFASTALYWMGSRDFVRSVCRKPTQAVVAP